MPRPIRINRACFKIIQHKFGTNFPLEFDFGEGPGNFKGKVKMHHDGWVTALWLTPNETYSSPSGLRHEIINPNMPTYKYFWHKGKNLHDLGVRR